MSLRLFCAIGVSLLAGLPCYSEGLLRLPGAWTPFVERLEKDEFLAVEHKLGGVLSDEKPDLLIYRATGRQIESSFFLSRSGPNRYQLTTALQGDSSARERRLAIPPAIAEKLLAAMQLCLTKQLYAPTGKAYLYPDNQSRANSGYWIYLRTDEANSIAGVVLLDRCITGHISVKPFLAIMGEFIRISEMTDAHEESFARLNLQLDQLKASYPGNN